MIIPRFIVIDDDKFNNALCTMVIAKVWKDAEVVTYHDPIAGFEYIVATYPKFTRDSPAILLLDINMPLMNGWEFLDRFGQKLNELKIPVSDHLKIYVLSSSVDKKDIEKAHLYKNVTDYIVKPITKDTIRHITGIESTDGK